MRLRQNGINDFKSINGLITFQRDYSNQRQQLFNNSASEVRKEKARLREEVALLEDFIATAKDEYERKLFAEIEGLKKELDALSASQSNYFIKLRGYFQRNSLQARIRQLERNFDEHVANSLRSYTDSHGRIKGRYDFIDLQFEEAVRQHASLQVRELDRRKGVVDGLTTSIYGAIGEQKVSNELQQLSDDYILINDFSASFHPAIYNKQNSDYIKSVQIDHVLVAPSGVFLIETKNWSEQSLESLDLRSPVDQVKRSSFALYLTLNGSRSGFQLRHHWGERKIPIKNLIVMVNQKPNVEFQYVKVLGLNELRGYIEYFNPCFSPVETKRIADHLLSLA